MEVPIYLFTGFLESGKTKFIQETMEDPRFETGEKTLIILCEEGEEEYYPERFSEKNSLIEIIEDEQMLTPQKLAKLDMKYAPERVVIEYNGMWQLNSLVKALPDNWLIYQEITFAKADTYESYNNNMRSLVVDKLNGCELVVFNRWSPAISQETLHKIVRGVTRRADIIFEDKNGNVQYDQIEDPLPFDINAKIIQIKDRDYALWFRDFAEETDKYIGKTVNFTGIVGVNKSLDDKSVIIGRHVMTCCVEDIEFKGLICRTKEPHNMKNKSWISLTGKISLDKHSAYGNKKGPVIDLISYKETNMPQPEVATFY